MQVICTFGEFNAQVNLFLAVANAVPGAMGREMKVELEPLVQAIEDLKTFEFNEDSVTEFNTKYAQSDEAASVYMDKNGDLIIDINERKIIEVTEIITDEVDFLVGIGVTIAGILMTVKSRMSKMFDKIDKVMTRSN